MVHLGFSGILKIENKKTGTLKIVWNYDDIKELNFFLSGILG